MPEGSSYKKKFISHRNVQKFIGNIQPSVHTNPMLHFDETLCPWTGGPVRQLQTTGSTSAGAAGSLGSSF